jgi:hypothetical protein
MAYANPFVDLISAFPDEHALFQMTELKNC